MERVVVSRPVTENITAMQVCAEVDATDEEILEVCNKDNPSGTTNGWTRVVRGAGEGMVGALPVICADDPGRTHFFVLC